MFLPVEIVLLGTTDEQKEKIQHRAIATLGMVSIPPFFGLLGRGCLLDPLLPGQKEVGRGCCAEDGDP